MSSNTTLENLAAGVRKARTRLDEMRLQGNLLKLEMREKKDAILEDLETAYDAALQHVREAARATGEKAEAARKNARTAWQEFRRRYDRVAEDEIIL